MKGHIWQDTFSSNNKKRKRLESWDIPIKLQIKRKQYKSELKKQEAVPPLEAPIIFIKK